LIQKQSIQSLGPIFEIVVTRQDAGTHNRNIPNAAVGGKLKYLAVWEHYHPASDLLDIHGRLTYHLSSYLLITMRK